MPVHKLNDAYVVINAVNLSTFVKQVRLSESVEALDDTTMGDTTKSNIGGLKDWSIEIDFVQDYAASAVDQTINGLVGSTTTFEIRATSSAVGTTNPKWTGTGLITEYSPVGGQVGELHVTNLKMVPNTALTRATA